MFTGLVEAKGKVIYRRPEAPICIGVRLPTSWSNNVSNGASICCNGVCLTVTKLQAQSDSLIAEFEIGNITLERTNAGSWSSGTEINLERSLTLNKPLGGHIVSGHIDEVATITEAIDNESGSKMITCGISKNARRLICPKGSIAINGVSLTVVDCSDVANNQHYFTTMLIPATLNATNLISLQTGSEVNIEADMLARYAENAIAFSRSHS